MSQKAMSTSTVKINKCYKTANINVKTFSFKLFVTATQVKRSKVKVSRSQGQKKIVYKNIKYMPQTSSDNGNIPVLYEIEVDGANGSVRFLTGTPK